jgi:hypothetical protein
MSHMAPKHHEEIGHVVAKGHAQLPARSCGLVIDYL